MKKNTIFFIIGFIVLILFILGIIYVYYSVYKANDYTKVSSRALNNDDITIIDTNTYVLDNEYVNELNIGVCYNKIGCKSVSGNVEMTCSCNVFRTSSNKFNTIDLSYTFKLDDSSITGVKQTQKIDEYSDDISSVNCSCYVKSVDGVISFSYDVV